LNRWAIVDTNVVVSGVISDRPGSPPQRIVDAMLSDRLRFLVSEELVFEYRRALLFPRIVARHGLPEAGVDVLLEDLLLNAGIRDAPVAAVGEVNGPGISGDEHVVALLRAQPGAMLITGDGRLADAIGGWCQVLTPAEFAATLD
jgi:predicted nucleic acid-binding protein